MGKLEAVDSETPLDPDELSKETKVEAESSGEKNVEKELASSDGMLSTELADCDIVLNTTGEDDSVEALEMAAELVPEVANIAGLAKTMVPGIVPDW